MYGNKKCRKSENSSSSIDPKDLEDDTVNSFNNEETRKSFIPIIHRNTLLAMYNLINGALNTFNCKFKKYQNMFQQIQDDLELDTNTVVKAAVDDIFGERDHAISFEDWGLKVS
jgi:hypothetical protein